MNDKPIDMYALLRKMYRPGEYALLPEVRNAAAFGASRSADYLAISMWPSRGLEIIGFEEKSYRGDWLNERKNPEKAEAIFKFCDRWFLVTHDPNICLDDELPPTWGLMAVYKNKLKVLKPAPKLDPSPVSRTFLAAIMKRATGNMVPRSGIKAELSAQYECGLKRGRNESAGEVERCRRDAERWVSAVKEFEDASGIKFDKWDAGKIGAAVRLVLAGGTKEYDRQLRSLSELATSIDQQIKKSLEGL